MEIAFLPSDALTRWVGESRWIGVRDDTLPAPLLVRLGTSREGRLVCTGLILGDAEPKELTARGLRSIPLAQIVAMLAQEAGDEGFWAGALAGMIRRRAEPYQGPQTRPGPKGHPADHYEQVAAAYRQALVDHPRAPMKALAAQLHVSDATVRRWVQRARDKGLLGPSVPGKAGEEALP
jgi:hypothetical protein